MKISESWLRKWIDVPADLTAIADRLNRAGIEAQAVPASAALSSRIVTARIISLQPHPQAERLRVCQVDSGDRDLRTIVCGAANARAGLNVVLALPGAVLPGIGEIRESALRGVNSAGMLCSASELGLAEKSDGLLELDALATVGLPIDEYLDLSDSILELDITPNRGDCLSLLGVARELGALYCLPLEGPAPHIEPTVENDFVMKITIEDHKACTRYCGRAVLGIDASARTPDWMRERLRRSGLRSIHPAVDVANYVMLELGQPMHAFDLATLTGGITARRARAGETLALLTGETIELDAADLIISDERRALAVAGVMGGCESAVSLTSTSVFFESAWFDPATVAAAGRRHRLLSDSRYRFERGIDHRIQNRALDRATMLLMGIAGGRSSATSTAEGLKVDPSPILLRLWRLHRLIGHPIPALEAETLLRRLGFKTQAIDPVTWEVDAAAHRPDVRIEADLIEEIARLYGYENIPARTYRAALAPWSRPETERSLDAAKDLLVARGYAEVITYSFVDPALEALLTPEAPPLRLDNPITETMAVMRSSLWPGLLSSWRHNVQRQQPRARLFEAGACFFLKEGRPEQRIELAALMAGTPWPEQWGSKSRPADYYDLVADLRVLVSPHRDVSLKPQAHSALHPGQSARVVIDGIDSGWIGALHPRIAQTLDLAEAPLLFALDWAITRLLTLPRHQLPSEFPAARRDRAMVVAESVQANTMCQIARAAGGEALRAVFPIDVYRGSGLPNGHKSITLGLIFQQQSRTLTLDEIEAVVGEISAALEAQVGAIVRG